MTCKVAPIKLTMPINWSLPFVFSSPHSGTGYPTAFLEQSRLDLVDLRQSEDSYVDHLYSDCSRLGAPLLAAQFPRIYCDPNRHAWELDPRMYSDALPRHALTRSPRIANGLGTIARYAANGQSIYRSLLKFEDAEYRIETCHKPYHEQLQNLLSQAVNRFGFVILIDCHSMPSRSRINGQMKDNHRPDFVLGDRFGQSCHPDVTELATAALQNLGYDVISNIPYAGGFITENYGQPDHNIHSLQIEINRRLYMDEDNFLLIPNHRQLMSDLTQFIKALGRISLPERMNAAE